MLIIGDVALYHDLSSLALLSKLKPNLDILVLDNDGGRIFDHLPLANSELPKSHFKDFWTMPTAIKWEHLGSAFGLDTQMFNAKEFSAAKHLTFSDSPRLTVVKVAPHGAADLWNQVKDDISSLDF